MSRLLALATAGALLLAASTANAGASGTSDVACGWSSSGWNAPNGALVTNRAPGPVRAVLDAVGEYRTHSMVSHGPGGWVSHETMYSPGQTGWPTYCSTPANPTELRDGYPGASQTDQGGIYTFIYHGGNNEYLRHQTSRSNGVDDTRGAAAANWLWSSAPYSTVYSKQDGSRWIYRLKSDSGAFLNYVLYQYRDLGGVATGTPGWNNGMVCSTMIAYAQNKSGGGTVSSGTYNHTQLVTAGNALYNAVYDSCDAGLGFWASLGASVTCLEGICDDAARQVRNCMVAGRCDTDSSSVWSDIANNSATVARSISPDRLAGINGEGVQMQQHNATNSMYEDSPPVTTQWNSGGNVYGCFF